MHASLEATTFGQNNYWAPLQGKQDSGVAEGRVEAAVLTLPRKDPPPSPMFCRTHQLHIHSLKGGGGPDTAIFSPCLLLQ